VNIVVASSRNHKAVTTSNNQNVIIGSQDSGVLGSYTWLVVAGVDSAPNIGAFFNGKNGEVTEGVLAIGTTKNINLVTHGCCGVTSAGIGCKTGGSLLHPNFGGEIKGPNFVFRSFIRNTTKKEQIFSHEVQSMTIGVRRSTSSSYSGPGVGASNIGVT